MKYSIFHLLYLTLESFISQILAKSELLKCIQSPGTQPKPPICYDCSIMNGAAIVHFLPATRNTTAIMNMQIYSLTSDASVSTIRIDIVWDTYLSDSLKDFI